jgi:ubiquinone/menaquinone biosynthesis C-methylase UbiE
MLEYLGYKFEDTPEFISTFDEAPLWSASFGSLLLKHVEIRRDMVVLDLGSGAGFPLMELAARLGPSSKLYGIDPWSNANTRARQKIKNYGLGNVEIIESSASQLPFDDESIDLIVSNLGINNFDDPQTVFLECARVLKPGGRLALTTNLNGHWKEFYAVFEDTLVQQGMATLVAPLQQQQEHRGSVTSIAQLFRNASLQPSRHFEENFTMRFADGSAFLNHYFVKLGWLSSWIALIPAADRVTIFTALEINLNKLAKSAGELSLTVPMAFIEGIKSAGA